MTNLFDDLALVPKDDDARSFSDSALPIKMVVAGEDAIDRAQRDIDRYVSGETIDWDSGMIAVATYREMLSARSTTAIEEAVGRVLKTAEDTLGKLRRCAKFYALLHDGDTQARFESIANDLDRALAELQRLLGEKKG